MLPKTTDPLATIAWSRLRDLSAPGTLPELCDLLAGEPDRFERWVLRCGDIICDFSKQRANTAVREALFALAREVALPEWIEALFSGAEVNNTEGRAAKHWALRLTGADDASSRELFATVLDARQRMYQLAEDLRAGRLIGASGRPLRQLVNIGIGGSDLGPRLACDALAPYCATELAAAFVANVDAAELGRVLAHCRADETLFVVTSKTFTTQETLRNAQSAKAWLRAALGGEAELGAHFVAVTSNPEAAAAFGIDADRVLPMWDWVGGRYSVWSAVGFTLAAMIGPKGFDAFLGGGAEIDRHFRVSPLAKNAPVLAALFGLWNRNFLNFADQVVVPYARGLELFAAYLQQLDMESNGKGVNRLGQPLGMASCPAVWGTVGTSGQHAYFQWLHQGIPGAPVDFVLVAQPEVAWAEHHEMLLANALAQSQALLQGKALSAALAETPARTDLAAHRSFPGGRPSTTLLLPRLDPRRLGQLLAFHEHKTFAQGVLWGVNPFDQWGVELGKNLASPLLDALRGGPEPEALDASTRGLLREIKALRGGSARG